MNNLRGITWTKALSSGHLLKANIIHLIETSIDMENEANFRIEGFKSHFVSVGNGKGLVTFFKLDRLEHDQDVKETNLQISKFSSPHLDVVTVYRSRNGHSVDLLNYILRMLTDDKPTLITGDFNICYMSNGNNRMSQGLIKNNFSQLVREPTQIQGGHIDHAYWRDKNGVWKEPVIEHYTPYYSDHDGICTTLTKSNLSKSS